MKDQPHHERLQQIHDRLIDATCGLKGLGTVVVHASDDYAPVIVSELGSAVKALGHYTVSLAAELEPICRELQAEAKR